MTSWLQSEILAADPDAESFRPAANGLKRRRDHLYVSNSSRGTIHRVALSAANEPVGDLDLVAETGPVDDFVFAENGDIFATTHGESLLRVTTDGSVHVVMETGCGGCTSVAIDRSGKRPSLLVVSTGHLLEGRNDVATILRVWVPDLAAVMSGDHTR